MPETHFIEVRAGRGEPPSLELRPGVELAPLSVGTGGAWQVSAPGVLPVHLYIYFDGQTLFLQSAEAHDPPMMDDQPVPDTWTAVSDGCDITFGQAHLTYRPADQEQALGDDDLSEDAGQEEPTYAQPFQEDFPSSAPAVKTQPPAAPIRAPARVEIPARPFKPGAFSAPVDDGESTRLQPLEDFASPMSGDPTKVELLHENRPPVGVRPAAGAPWTRAETQPAHEPMRGAEGFGQDRPFPPAPFQPPVPAFQPAAQVHRDGPPSGLLDIAPPSIRKPQAPETFEERVKREWGAAPPLRKALVAAVPFAVIILAWATFSGSTPPPPSKGSTASTASAPRSVPTVAAQPPPIPTPWPPPAPLPPPIVPQPNPAANPATSPATNPAANPAAGAVPDAGIDRRERQAADFVATHAYDQAIRLYEALAAERPQNPAYHEAARILRTKLETNTP